MIPIISFSYVARLVFIAFLFTDFGNSINVTSDIESREIKTEPGFAVVELFTSEGCSSCPAADDAMIELSNEFSDQVYFLGFHVDYWNYLGWKDEYSNKAFTERQSAYANHFNLNSIYTPQVVVNGKKEFIGSDKNKLKQAIKDELANVSNEKSNTATIELKAIQDNANHINITYKKTGATKNEQLLISLVQLMAVTNVKRGENRGHELKHINIVREFKNADLKNATIQFAFPQNLTTKDLKIVAFVQDKNSLQITGAISAFIK